MSHDIRELTIGQRSQLGVLCAQYDKPTPLESDERSTVVAGSARFARYLADLLSTAGPCDRVTSSPPTG